MKEFLEKHPKILVGIVLLLGLIIATLGTIFLHDPYA
jgi:hypothetical protein